MEGKRRQKRYRRLDRAERAAIQNGLKRGWSCRRMACELGRSPSTVADEVSRNRTVAKGPGKGDVYVKQAESESESAPDPLTS